MDPASLIAAAKDIKAISDFVYGHGLEEAVSEIVGDIHMSAAKLALETVKLAEN